MSVPDQTSGGHITSQELNYARRASGSIRTRHLISALALSVAMAVAVCVTFLAAISLDRTTYLRWILPLAVGGVVSSAFGALGSIVMIIRGYGRASHSLLAVSNGLVCFVTCLMAKGGIWIWVFGSRAPIVVGK
jgi:hypothetical protein